MSADGIRKTILFTNETCNELQKRANQSTNGNFSEYVTLVLNKHLAAKGK